MIVVDLSISIKQSSLLCFSDAFQPVEDQTALSMTSQNVGPRV